jgi:hypothetical protein
MTRVLRFFIVFQVFSSCSSGYPGEGSPILEIDVKMLIQVEEQLGLSSLTDSILYIFPEFRNDYIPGNFRSVHLTNDMLVIVDEFSRIFIYDRGGTLINCISRLGRGPEEYSSMTGIWIGNDTIIVLDRSSYLISYKFDGSYISHKKLPAYSPAICDFFGQPVIMSGYSLMQDKDNPFLMHVYSSELTHRFSFYHKDRNNLQPQIQGLDYYQLYRIDEDTMYYRTIHNDTIYSVTKQGDFFPRYIVKYDQAGSNQDIINTDRPLPTDFTIINRVYELGEFVIIDLIASRLRYTPIFNKSVSTGYNVYFNYDLTDNGFHNDLDGGYPFFPKAVSPYTGELYTWFDPIDFREEFHNPYYKTIIPKYPEMYDQIRDYIDSADANTNPCIMIIR